MLQFQHISIKIKNYIGTNKLHISILIIYEYVILILKKNPTVETKISFLQRKFNFVVHFTKQKFKFQNITYFFI